MSLTAPLFFMQHSKSESASIERTVNQIKAIMSRLRNTITKRLQLTSDIVNEMDVRIRLPTGALVLRELTLKPLSATIFLFNMFYKRGKPLLLGIKYLFKMKIYKMYGLKLNIYE